jgi:predicted phosphoribosyltransferase
LPRGGVAVAAEIAAALAAPLDLVLVRKLPVPDEPEVAMGAVVDRFDPVIVRNEEVIRACGVSEQEFAMVCAAEHREIERRRELYLSDRPAPKLAGRCVIVVDDGIATGATTRAALQAVRQQHPRRLVLAVPVAGMDSLEELRGEADELVCLSAEPHFHAVGMYYDDFRQIGDSEVIALLNRCPSDARNFEARKSSAAIP